MTFKNHPLYRFPKLWHDFSNYEIKIQCEKKIFNGMLKKFMISTLLDVYICDRLLCPACHLDRQGPTTDAV